MLDPPSTTRGVTDWSGAPHALMGALADPELVAAPAGASEVLPPRRRITKFDEELESGEGALPILPAGTVLTDIVGDAASPLLRNMPRMLGPCARKTTPRPPAAATAPIAM